MKSFASSASYSIDLTAYQQSLTQLSNQIKASLNEIKITSIAAIDATKTENLHLIDITKNVATAQIQQESEALQSQIQSQIQSQANFEIIAIQQKGQQQVQAIDLAIANSDTQIDSINTAIQQMTSQYEIIEANLALVQPYVEALVQQGEDQLAIFIQSKEQKTEAQLAGSTLEKLNQLQAKLDQEIVIISQASGQANSSLLALKDASVSTLESLTAAKVLELQQKITDAESVFAQLDQAVGASIQSYQEIQNLVNQAQIYVQQAVDTAAQEAQLEINSTADLAKQAILAQQVLSVAAVNNESQADISAINNLTSTLQLSLQTTTNQGVNILNSSVTDNLNALDTKQQDVVIVIEDARDAALNQLQIEETQAQNQLQSFETQLLQSLSSASALATSQLHEYFLQLVQQMQNSGSSGSSGLLVGAVMYTANSQQWVNSGRWLLCKGQQFDIALYPDLYAFLGTNVLPNLSNQFVRCIDDSGSRMPLSQQLDSLKAHNHFVQINTTNSGGHSHTTNPVTVNATTATAGQHDHRINGYSASGVGGTSSTSASGDVVVYNNDGQAVTTGLTVLPNTTQSGAHSHTFTVFVPSVTTSLSDQHSHTVQGYTADFGDTETAPKNVALYAIMKTDNL